MEPQFIDTSTALASFLNDLNDCDGQPPRFCVDLEGNNLSRRGTLSLVTVLLEPERTVHLVDVTTLGPEAFTIAGANGRTLRSVLESKDIVKVFFDIRNDSDALFGLYGIRVAGIEDLQLMELASRTFSKRKVNGLARCIERDDTIDFQERNDWRAVKDQGKRLFDPQQGGSYAVFDQRPLSQDVKDYCTQDDTFMPHLRDVYRRKLCDAWWRKIEAETDARIRLSQSPTFVGKGQHMAQTPPAWLSWRPSPAERLLRTLCEMPAPRAKARMTATTLPTQSSGPTQLDDADALADMLHCVVLTGRGSNRDLAVALDDGDVVGDFDSDRDYYESSSDEFRDLTACDSECGYCGRCDY